MGMARQAREGFFQKKVFSFFGFYPWECAYCRVHKLMHNRGVRVRINQRVKDESQVVS